MINSIYLSRETLGQLADYFSTQPLPSVTLSQFFTPVILHQMSEDLRDIQFKRDGFPTSHSYGIGKLPSDLIKILNSKELKLIISEITEVEVKSVEGKSYEFNWKDYTILHDETLKNPGFDLIVDLTPTWQDRLGGVVTYIDNEGQSFVIPSNYGSITLVQRSENAQYFVKYVNHYAQDLSRYLVLADIKVKL